MLRVTCYHLGIRNNTDLDFPGLKQFLNRSLAANYRVGSVFVDLNDGKCSLGSFTKGSAFKKIRLKKVCLSRTLRRWITGNELVEQRNLKLISMNNHVVRR